MQQVILRQYLLVWQCIVSQRHAQAAITHSVVQVWPYLSHDKITIIM